MKNNKKGKLPKKDSQTAILIAEMAERKTDITTSEAIKLLEAHGHATTSRKAYSLLNGHRRWFNRVAPHTFRLTRESYLRAMQPNGVKAIPRAVQKKCKKCKDPFIDETSGAKQKYCGGEKCKRKWTKDQRNKQIQDAALRRLETGVPRMA